MLYNYEKYQDIGDDPVVCRNSSNLEFKQDLQLNMKWSILENRDGTSLSSDRNHIPTFKKVRNPDWESSVTFMVNI